MKTMIGALSLAALTMLAAAPTPGRADTLGPRDRDDRGEITRLGKGLMEIGLDSLFVWTSRSVEVGGTTTKASTSTVSVGPTFRYFLIDNLGLSLNVNALVSHDAASTETAGVTDEVSNTELGVLGLVDLDYYVALGHGFFLKPGLGGGGFWKSRDEPLASDPSLKRTITTTGGAFRVQLGFVYYASPKFTMRASVDFLGLFGTRTSDGSPDESLLQMDLGWNVGAGYVF